MAPFSNACAKYVHLGSTFAVFLEHVWRFSSHTTCILHTCSKNTSIAKVGKYLGKRWSKRFRSSTKTTYSSSTCANKSADRRVVFETITFHRRIRYIRRPTRRPARRRTWLLSRTRPAANLAPFSNTCAKYVHLGSTFAVFLEHVWRFSSHTTCILHTCSKNTSIAKVGKYLGKRWSKRFRSSTKTTYSSSTCANKSADRRVVFETITFHRRIRYIFAPWDRMLCFW